MRSVYILRRGAIPCTRRDASFHNPVRSAVACSADYEELEIRTACLKRTVRASKRTPYLGRVAQMCISRESSPGHIDGNDVFYH